MACQTGIIVRTILTPNRNPTDAMIRAMDWLEDAVWASNRIPPRKTANEAAAELLHYLFEVPEEEGDPGSWFMREGRNTDS